jgi:hypothetical protein
MATSVFLSYFGEVKHFAETGSKFKVQRLVEKGFLQPGTMNPEPNTFAS